MKLDLTCGFDFASLGQIGSEAFSLSKNGPAALFVIDMNKGFCVEGALASGRIARIIPDVVRTVEIFARAKAPVVAFTDRHSRNAAEFSYLPVHCVAGTAESELVDELVACGGAMTVIGKNSTNGFMEPEAQELIRKLTGSGFGSFVITGCCTDICVKTFAVTLKTYFNRNDMELNVVVPMDAVETYDAPGHDAAAMNLFALHDMRTNGIRIVSRVTA
jgi:Amidases related to nicotinamidase